MIKRCIDDCYSDHTNKSTESGMRSASGYATNNQGLTKCIEECNDRNKPLKHYNVKTATKNGWYIFSKINSHQMAEYYLAHKSMTTDETDVINTESYLITNANEFDKKLDELPDLKKTYKTGSWYTKKKTWKLIYNNETGLFEWQNQTDKTTHPFLIESPLKIGDKIATESR